MFIQILSANGKNKSTLTTEIMEVEKNVIEFSNKPYYGILLLPRTFGATAVISQHTPPLNTSQECEV